MKSKRLISILLSLLMVISLVPISVFADETPAPAAEEPVKAVAEEAEEITEETEEVITEEAPVLEATDAAGHELKNETVDASLYPTCEHSNRPSGYADFEFSYPTATSLTVTFTAESAFGYSERLEILDSDGSYLCYYDAWTPISGASFTTCGNSFTMSMYSDRYDNSYGFEIASIEAVVPQHSATTAGAYLAPTCTEDGYEAGYICGICGEDIHGDVLPATGHTFTETVTEATETEFGYSTFACHCGESYVGKYRGYGPHYQDDITDTMSWIMEDGVLYILGSGEMPDGWISYKNWTDQENITSVVISEGITRIGDGAFTNESNIASVTIPSTVKEIGDQAFCGMTALKSITLPDGLEWIDDDAFSSSGLTSITIPDSVTHIGKYAFRQCASLAEVNFGSGLESIELMAFEYCTSLASVFFPANIEYISQSAFRYCSNLQEITFGEPVARGGYNEGLRLSIEAFGYCDLREVYLPSRTQSIDGGTFASNPKLTAVHVSTTQTLNSIEGPKYLTDSRGCVYEWYLDYSTNEYYQYDLVVIPGALSGSYVVPDCVRTIEAEIRDMPNLTSFTFGAGYGGIWNAYAFVNCPKLTKVKAGGPAEDGWFNDSQGALYNSRNGETCQLYFVPANATEYTLPANCSNISSTGALSNPKLKNIFVAEGNTYFKSVDGVLYNYNGTYLKKYPTGRTDTKFTFPATLEEVDSSAFLGCTSITDFYFTGDFNWIYYDELSTHDITIWYPADNTTWDPEMLKVLTDEYGYTCDYTITFKPYGAEEETKITAPANVKASIVAASGKPKITWDKVEGAVKYEVWRATTATGKGSRMSSLTGTTLTNKSAKPGTKYYYYVLAFAEDGTVSEASDRVSIVCDYAQPVVTITNDAATGKPKLTWTAVEGATSYKIYRATSKSGTYSVMKTQSGTTYTNSNAVVNKTYYYKVKAFGANSNATSAYSAVVSRLCDLKRPTVTLSNVASSGKIKVAWTKVDGAAKYQVYRATTKNGTYSLKKTTTSLSWTDTNTTAGKTYYYKVKAIHSNTNANSALTSYKSRMADLKRPTVSITTSSGKPKVSWTAVTGAKEYKIYRSTSKTGTYKVVKTTTSKSWKDTTAKKGKTYYYKVVAVHKSSGANSAYSTVVSKKCTK